MLHNRPVKANKRPLKTNNKSAKFEALNSFCLLLLFALARERISIEINTQLKVNVTGAENFIVCRRVRASFGPEILQAGTVKGLTYFDE